VIEVGESVVINADGALEQLRGSIPLLERLVWLDTPAAPPAASPVLLALRQALDQWASGEFDWLAWEDEAYATRPLFARILGASSATVALMSSLSEAAATVAASVKHGPVLVCEREFRSNLFPWLALRERGVEVIEVPQREGESRSDALLAAVHDKIELVAVSEVLSETGERVDLVALGRQCAAAGAHLFVNLTQSLGALRFDASAVGADFVAAHGYKWLLAPRGAAWLHVREDRVGDLRPLAPSWRSSEDPYREYFGGSFDLASGARRFDTSFSWLPWIGARAALELICSLDPQAVEQHALGLAAQFRTRAEEHGHRCIRLGRPSQIVALRVSNPASLRLALKERSVIASIRGDLVRFGFHAFNHAGDVDAALDALGAAK
jgi:selenocysteine lyase/cysteine desulfurase